MIDPDVRDLRSALDAELAGPSPESARAHARRRSPEVPITNEELRTARERFKRGAPGSEDADDAD